MDWIGEKMDRKRRQELLTSNPETAEEVKKILVRENMTVPEVYMVIRMMERGEVTISGGLAYLVSYQAREVEKARDAALRNVEPPLGPFDIHIDLTGLIEQLKIAARDLEKAGLIIAKIHPGDVYKEFEASVKEIRATIKKAGENPDILKY